MGTKFNPFTGNLDLTVLALDEINNVDTTTIPKQVGNPLVWNGSKWVASPTNLGFTSSEGLDVHYGSTVLQLNFDAPNNTAASGLIDDSPSNRTFTGDGLVTSTNPKAGTGALSGTINVSSPSSLAIPANTALTVEFWIRDWSTGTTNTIVTTIAQSVRVSATGQASFIQPSSAAWTHPTLMVRGVWNHVALTRQSGSSPQWRLHVNGVASTVNTVNWSWSPSSSYVIGSFGTVIDLFRQTTGIARYGQDTFTPPPGPYLKGNGITLSTIDTFDDVDTRTNSPTSGQALVWDQVGGKWVPSTVAFVGGSSGQILYNLSGAVAGTSVTFSATTGTRHVLPFGYGAGSGGVVTQVTDKSTGVTLNTRCGQVTMNNANLVTATAVSFTLINSQIAATDVLILNNVSGGTLGAYMLDARCTTGSATITVRNLTAGDLAEALVIGFAVIKASTT